MLLERDVPCSNSPTWQVPTKPARCYRGASKDSKGRHVGTRWSERIKITSGRIHAHKARTAQETVPLAQPICTRNPAAKEETISALGRRRCHYMVASDAR